MMMRRILVNNIAAVGLALMGLLCALALQAQAQSGDVEVDVELVLAVDVSRSMSPRELEIQRRGYAEALTSDDVVAAIEGGLIGQIALRYIEWAGDGSQRVIVDWSLIGGRADAERFAAQLVAQFDPTLRRTSISSALDYSRRSFDNNGFVASRRVIDISGDGPNNSGGPVLEARRRALDAGIVINGLPLMTRDGIYSRFDLPDLDNYYRECVIGGPASFVIPVIRWDQFPTAVRQKLIQELAATEPAEPLVKQIAFHQKAEPAYDCLIGEKMWRQRRLDWGDDL